MPSDALLRMARRWEREGNEPHGLVVIGGTGRSSPRPAWQPWPRDGIRLVYSVSKTFLAVAAVFAEADGRLGRDERLVDVFPEYAHAAGPRAARITVEHCLRMATGHHVDTLDGFVGQGEESVAVFLAAEPEQEPGSWFVYHNGASRVLALAVQRRTGERLLLSAAPPARPDGHRRGGLARLGRNRSGLQRAPRRHRRRRPARSAAAPGRRVGGPPVVASRMGRHGVSAADRHHAPPRPGRLEGGLRVPDVAQHGTTASGPTAPTASSPSWCRGTTSSWP